MARIVKKKSSAGAGCLVQGIGLVSLLLAVLSIPTIIGPLILAPLGLFLLAWGGRMAVWWECSDCGTKLSGKKLRICPGCREPFN
jgi:hypothetical protein